MAPPTSLRELYDRAPDVVLGIAGGAAIRLDGGYARSDPARGMDGEYKAWEQRLYLDSGEVEAYLDDLLRGRLNPSDNQRAANALATLNHELIHATGPQDIGPDFGIGKVLDAEDLHPPNPGPRYIEEGITEAWTRRTFREFVSKLELVDLAPWLYDTEIASRYAAEEILLQPLIATFAELSRTGEDEILRLMASEVPDTRSMALAMTALAARGQQGDGQAAAIAAVFDGFMDYRIPLAEADHGQVAARAIVNILS